MTRFTVLIALALLGAACSDHYHRGYYYAPDDRYNPDLGYCDEGVFEADVDRGVVIELDPGAGVGATIEYAGDGAWRVAVTCDLAVNPYAQGIPCYWDVIVSSVSGYIDSFEPERLEADDVIEWYPTVPSSGIEDAVRLESSTDIDIDAFTLQTAPGDGLRIDALLDGSCAGPYLIWSEGGGFSQSYAEITELFPDAP